MKKILILGGGFTAGKRLDQRTLRFNKLAPPEKVTDKMAMLPNDHHPGAGCSCRDCLKHWPSSICPSCSSPEKDVRNLVSGETVSGHSIKCENPWHETVPAPGVVNLSTCPSCGSQSRITPNPIGDRTTLCKNEWHIDLSVPPHCAAATSTCPTCGTDDPTETARKSPGGWVDCRDTWHNTWHKQRPDAVGSHNASSVKNADVERCADCGSSSKLGGDVAIDDIDCMNGFHYRRAPAHPAARCPTCLSSEKDRRGRDVYPNEPDLVCQDHWHKASPCPTCHMFRHRGDIETNIGVWPCTDSYHDAPAQPAKKTDAERCPKCHLTSDEWHSAEKGYGGGVVCRSDWHTVNWDAAAPAQPADSCPSCESKKRSVRKGGLGVLGVGSCMHPWHSGVDAPAQLVGASSARADEPLGSDIHTIDSNKKCNPTWVWDLNETPWPPNCGEIPYGRDEWCHEYDEVHAYEILEHLGHQGDANGFFNTFAQIWGALKPGGLLLASCPSYKSLWAWGDPSHTRIINAGSLVFLMRSEYEKQIGRTAMSDYRNWLVGDWELVNHNDDGESFRFVLRAK